MKTQSPEQSIVGHETQWTQPWPRVRSQVDVIHLVHSTGAIVSNPHLYSVESCPEKSRPIKHGDQLHGLMIAIEYSYKLDRKNCFNLWCELGLVRTRPVIAQTVTYIHSHEYANFKCIRICDYTLHVYVQTLNYL